MPITYTVDHRSMRVYAIATELISAEDIAHYIADRFRDGVQDYDQLVDFSAAMFAVDADTLVQTVQSTRRNLGAGPVVPTAIVAPEGLGAEATARALAAAFSSSGAKMRIFGTQLAAASWLDRLREPRSGGPSLPEPGGEPRDCASGSLGGQFPA